MNTARWRSALRWTVSAGIRNAPAGPPAVLAAPMRAEATALRRGAGDRILVLHTGTGPLRSRRSAGRLPDRPVALAGTGGSLLPQLRTGDVVVATELRTTGRFDPVVRMPAAGTLVAALRAAGLRVHVGPVVCVRRILTSRAERGALAATGALLVDTESYWLLGGGPVRRLACVRVVADTPPEMILRPGTLPRLRTALHRLRPVGDVLADWVADEGFPTRWAPRSTGTAPLHS